MAHYNTLKAWQHAQRLAVECAKAARGFPAWEQDALADRLRHACYRVPLNIAAGNRRQGVHDCRRALDAAHAALAEVETILDIARQLEYVRPAEFGRLEALATETGKLLYGLVKKARETFARPAPRPG